MKPTYEELETKLKLALDKIKASQEQEPVCYETLQNYLIRGNLPSLYKQPIIPPEVAELQRERDELIVKLHDAHYDNAELTRKLVEQGDLFNAVLAPRETSIAKLREHFLEEAKRQAVPDGWKLVPIEPTDNGVGGMVNAGAIALKQHDDTPFMNNRTGIAKFVYEAMLSAAPQPERKD